MQITLVKQDTAGKQTISEATIGFLPFLKSLATAGEIDRTWFQTCRKIVGALLFYWEHFDFFPLLNFGLRPWHHNDTANEFQLRIRNF